VCHVQDHGALAVLLGGLEQGGAEGRGVEADGGEILGSVVGPTPSLTVSREPLTTSHTLGLFWALASTVLLLAPTSMHFVAVPLRSQMVTVSLRKTLL
jgi:hypothetical protein